MRGDMILYLDTAVLLSLHLYDSKTEAVTKTLGKDKYEFAVSGWGVAEAASALGILVRRKELDSKLATEVLEGVELLVAESQVLSIDAATLRLATNWLKNFNLGLRAGDAVHAALCKINDVTLATTDRQLIRAVKKLQVKCLAL
jgi:uncharacterized protein